MNYIYFVIFSNRVVHFVPWQSQYSSQERLHLASAVTPEHSPATPSSLTRSRQHYDSNDSNTPLVEAELADIPSNSSSNSSGGVRSPLIRPRSHSLRSVSLLGRWVFSLNIYRQFRQNNELGPPVFLGSPQCFRNTKITNWPVERNLLWHLMCVCEVCEQCELLLYLTCWAVFPNKCICHLTTLLFVNVYYSSPARSPGMDSGTMMMNNVYRERFPKVNYFS